jgi:hypothetical protein
MILDMQNLTVYTRAVLLRKAKNIQNIHKHYIWESRVIEKNHGVQTSNVHSNIRMTNLTSTPLTCSSLAKNGAHR